MAIVNGYCSLDEIKHPSALNIDDNDNDTALERVIVAVSRWIDGPKGCRRRFYTVEQARYYTACQDWLIEIDDLVTLTTLKTDPDGDATYTYNWASTDYLLTPYNAAANGEPYTGIETTPRGSYRFPVNAYRSRVQVTGAFGFCAIANVPAVIKEACLLMGTRVFLRIKDKPFGVSGSADLGTLEVINAIGKDDEIQGMLKTIRQRVYA